MRFRLIPGNRKTVLVWSPATRDFWLLRWVRIQVRRRDLDAIVLDQRLEGGGHFRRVVRVIINDQAGEFAVERDQLPAFVSLRMAVGAEDRRKLDANTRGSRGSVVAKVRTPNASLVLRNW